MSDTRSSSTLSPRGPSSVLCEDDEWNGSARLEVNVPSEDEVLDTSQGLGLRGKDLLLVVHPMQWARYSASTQGMNWGGNCLD